MNKLAILVVPFFVAGCESVVDPAPYSPGADVNVFPPAMVLTEPHAVALQTTSVNLTKLANDYSLQRNNMMSEQLLFDIPMMGLAAATVANGMFRGVKDVTLGLGLGSASFAAGRSYFGPQVKILAYNSASSSLSCASSFALTMASETQEYYRIGVAQRDALATYISDANTALVNQELDTTGPDSPEKLQKDTAAALLAARDSANTAYQDLFGALASLDMAPSRLQSFTTLVVKATTDKIVTGTQNIDTAVKLIQASAPPPASPQVIAPKSTATGSDALSDSTGGTYASVAQLISDLQTTTSNAQTTSKAINDSWAGLATCTVAQ